MPPRKDQAKRNQPKQKKKKDEKPDEDEEPPKDSQESLESNKESVASSVLERMKSAHLSLENENDSVSGLSDKSLPKDYDDAFDVTTQQQDHNIEDTRDDAGTQEEEGRVETEKEVRQI